VAKRVFDLGCCVFGLVITAVVWVVVVVLIKLEDGGAVIFKQRRIGQNGVPFHIWKFRTMVPDAEKFGGQITVGHDPRVTKIGRFLRKSKVDELPQLVNVFLGEMSFVGPRPEVPRYVELYSSDQRRVLRMKPGITDLASIRYRDENELLGQAADPELTYINEVMPEKIRINLEYSARATVWNDFVIIVMTLRRLLT
jgi:lipopolysaccharide/colanic/teichoic acid biosynthesis glycosyltransferase